MEEKKFQLLGVSGFDKAIEYNFKKNLIVYAIGSLLVFWDLNKDEKKYIKHHEGDIGVIKSSFCGNYIYTVDKLINPTIAVWSTSRNYKLLFQNSIPLSNVNLQYNIKNENKNQIKEIYLDCLNDEMLLMIVNVNDKQKLLLFEKNYITEISINLTFESNIDVDSSCSGLKCIENDNTFITQEDKLLKFWYIDNTKLQLQKKVHMKGNLIKQSLQLCNSFKVVLVLTDLGSAILLDTKVYSFQFL